MSIARKFLISAVLAWCPLAVAVSHAQSFPRSSTRRSPRPCRAGARQAISST